jgi:hypothetical protein
MCSDLKYLLHEFKLADALRHRRGLVDLNIECLTQVVQILGLFHAENS